MYQTGKILTFNEREAVFETGFRERVRIGEIVDACKVVKAYP